MTVTAKDRLIFTLSALKGYSVDVQLTSGLLLNGVLADTREIESHIVLAYAWTRFLTPRGPNGEEPKKAPRKKPDKLKKVLLEDIAWIQAFNVGMSDLALGPSRTNDINDFTDGGFPKAQRAKNRTLVAWTPGDDDTSANVGGWKTDKEEVDDQMDDLIQKAAHGEGGAPPGQWDQFALTNNCSAWKLNSTSLFIRHKSTSPKLASLKKKPHESREKLRVKCPRIRTLRKRETKNSSRILMMDEEAKYSSVSRAPGSEGFKSGAATVETSVGINSW